MSNVSKLVIKACSDNKFSSFTGEFITSINPENLAIRSGVAYHIPQGMAGNNLLQYRGSPPKLLSFNLLFDNTGIIPGSNTIHVIEQVKQLQDIAYNAHKKNNAPNYIRIIWGQIDFKGRLVELDIVYTRFQMDGTLIRAEAHIAVLEEIVPSGQGKTVAGIDSDYVQASGASVRSPRSAPARTNDAFAATPDGMDGAYSGAPEGAYDGGPDAPYQGPSAAGAGSDLPSSNAHGPEGAGGAAGNGAGSSGDGVGAGGGSGGKDGRGAKKPRGSGKAAGGGKSSRRKPGSGGRKPGRLNSLRNSMGKVNMGAVAAGLGAVAAGIGAVVAVVSALSWLERLKALAKKVAPKAYDAAKNVGSKGYNAGKNIGNKIK